MQASPPNRGLLSAHSSSQLPQLGPASRWFFILLVSKTVSSIPHLCVRDLEKRIYFWTQDEMVVLSNLNSLTQSLHSHTRCLARLPLGRLLPLIEPLAVMTDEQRQEAAAKRDLDSQHLQCEVVFPGAVQRYDHLTT